MDADWFPGVGCFVPRAGSPPRGSVVLRSVAPIVTVEPVDSCKPMTRRTQRLLFLDGLALALVGAMSVLVPFLSRDPVLEEVLSRPHTLAGWLEAHSLMALMGAVLLRASRREAEPFWHALALAAHLALGGASALCFEMFATLDMVAAGYATVAAHGVAVLLHGGATVVTLRRSGGTTASA